MTTTVVIEPRECSGINPVHSTGKVDKNLDFEHRLYRLYMLRIP